VIYLGRFGSGGPISLELARNLSDSANVLCFVSSYVENIHSWRQSGLPLVEFPTYTGFIQAIISILRKNKLHELSNKIRKFDPDVLLYPMLHPWVPFLQRKLSDIPSVMVLHDAKPHPGLFPKIMGYLDNFAIRNATSCVVLSVNQKVFAQSRRKHDKIHVVPLGILSYYAKEISRSTLEEYVKRDSLLFFGRITRYKGIEILLKAFGRLKRKFKWLKLLIAGAGDIRPYRKMLNMLDSVKLVNRWINEEEIPIFFKQARLVILPYLSASQSGVIATAAAFGVPVVATRTGGIPEQIKDGKTGCLIDPGSVDQLVTTVMHLLEDEQYAFSIGQNLMFDFEQNMNWKIIAKEFYNICEEAINEMRNL